MNEKIPVKNIEQEELVRKKELRKELKRRIRKD